MFTGLIRDVGTVHFYQRNSNSVRLSIQTRLPLNDLTPGASVACNGACLTVIDSNERSDTGCNEFFVEIGPETLALTRFGNVDVFGAGEQINLEPALRVGDALGGHVLSGHVDSLGHILVNESTTDGFWRLRVSCEPKFALYLVEKGSIAIAGVSLTIARCSQEFENPWVEIMLIPHTLQQTNLRNLKNGALVEVEFDSQAKLVANMLKAMIPNFLKSSLK